MAQPRVSLSQQVIFIHSQLFLLIEAMLNPSTHKPTHDIELILAWNTIVVQAVGSLHYFALDVYSQCSGLRSSALRSRASRSIVSLYLS